MKRIDYFIKKYLENRPLFHAFIRPQEASLFYENQRYIKSPILDFGCGDGFFSQIVFGKGKINIGLDLIKSRANEAEKENIYQKVVYYDEKTIPYPDDYFRTVISNCVLEHLPNLNYSLKEIHRVLKPGGYFLATVMTDRWEEHLLGSKIFGKFYKNFMRKIQQHHNLLTMKQWGNKFIKTGFKAIKSIGYFHQNLAQHNELFHYLSFPSFLSHKLFGRWVIFPKLNLSWKSYFKKIISSNNPDSFAACFYLLWKT